MASPKPDLSLMRSDEAPPLAVLAQEYPASCRSRGLSFRTIDNYQQCLSQLFLPWCGAARTERDRLIIRVLGDTGMRRGELVALTVGDLVERGRGCYFLRAHGKAQKDRLVAIEPKLWRRLKAFIGHTRPAETRSDHVFLSRRRGRVGDYERLTGSAIQQLVAVLGREAGLTKAVYPHVLRHSFITAMVVKGVPAEVIARHVGHESIQMISRVYSHIKTQTSHDLIIKALTEK